MELERFPEVPIDIQALNTHDLATMIGNPQGKRRAFPQKQYNIL